MSGRKDDAMKWIPILLGRVQGAGMASWVELEEVK